MIGRVRVYNSLSHRIEEFKPLKKASIGMYVCGPTVYGPGHIGHARTYIAFDIIRRYLEYKGYRVNYIVNITDVHDDMIAEANKKGVTIFGLAGKNIAIFMKDLKELGIKEPTKMPRVTQHIPEIIRMINILVKKGFAYETKDGVYFDVSKFPRYGKLASIKPKKGRAGTRVDADKYEKQSAMDFALWKKAKPSEPAWESPWGKGRPGWHIECSAMVSRHLGKRIDIHGGAADLKFPHHENEICQSEACFGVRPFVRYWMHAGFLNVRGEKMSKSLGNYITIPELLHGFNPMAFRYFISTLHYRSRVEFDEKVVASAARNLEKWRNTIRQLLGIKGSEDNPVVKKMVEKARKGFEDAMDSDFNLPNAWSVLYKFQSSANSLVAASQLSKKDAKRITAFLEELNSIFGFFSFTQQEHALPKNVLALVEKRERLRREKNFAEADKIRAQLLSRGIELMDTPEGVKWKTRGV